MKNVKLLFVPLIALSLSACGGGGSTSSTNSGGTAPSVPSHNIKISPEESSGPGLKGTGHLKTVERKLEMFHAIELVDMANVQLTIGMSLNCSIQVDDNLADAYDTTVKDGKLIISANKDFHTYRAPSFNIGVPELSEVYLTGPGQLEINGVKGDIFKVDASGTGKVFAAGRVINLKTINTGSALVDCAKITAEDVDTKSSGTGTTRVNVVKALNVTLDGTGQVKYLGSPASLTKNIHGTGTVEPLTSI